MICAVCPREARGFGWQRHEVTTVKKLRRIVAGKALQACSMECSRIIEKRQGDMVDPTTNEIASIIDAAEAGGTFLMELGKTDFAAMTEDEAMRFFDATITAFCDAMKQRCGFAFRENEAIPF